MGFVQQDAEQAEAQLLVVEFLQAASGDELGIERGIHQGLRQPAFHAVKGNIHFAHGGVTKGIMRLGEGQFLHNDVAMAQAPADVLAPQLHHNQPGAASRISS